MISNLPNQREVKWAEEDNESFRRGLRRAESYRFPDGFLQERPPPLFVGQELFWVESLNGSKLRDVELLAVNTFLGLAWRMQSERLYNHNWIFDPHEKL